MLRAGQTLGAYRIETILGRGAMGVVYRGVRINDGEPVALKTVCADLLIGTERDAILSRFHQEAQIGMQLRHPRIVRVHAWGEQDDIVYLAMDFVAGQELGRLVDHHPDLPQAMSLAMILQILNALAYIHQRGILHRDLKPANILVRRDYTIALTDFGIAHCSGSELTQLGDLLGSPLYMAPEQLRGEWLDCRADLFSVGVLLYYLLTHRKPFVAGSLAALMQQVLHADPAPPSTVNPALSTALDAVIQRALAKDRNQRFASAMEFAVALRQARTASDETTMLIPTGSRSLPLPPAPVQSAAVNLDALAGQMAALVRECLAEQATGTRIEQLTKGLNTWVAAIAADQTTDQQRLQWLCAGAPLAALAEQIERQAPFPGRALAEARGDWLELVQLFALLHNAGQRLGDAQAGDLARTRLIQELIGAFRDYANTLNPLLFSDDSPHLLQIAADLMRLDLLQLALEELGADAESRWLQQTLLLFVNQVVSKANALIRSFLKHRDPLARIGVVGLLVEIEELIVLAERLLEGSEAAVMATPGPGGAVVAECIGNIHDLGWLLGHELRQQVHDESLQKLGAADGEPDQALFLGRLRQIGLLYRFAVRLEGDQHATPLRKLVVGMHRFLHKLADRLLSIIQKTPALQDQQIAAERLWARLSLIAELAEQFGWIELRGQILLAARNWAAAPG
ncbi:MAG: serine/threonine-protein kinase [Candidatus Competibacteraceae bacterium]